MTTAIVSHPAVGKTERPNFCVVTVGEMEIWFSYQTPIAFRKHSGPLLVRQNEWGPTTGRHLNYLNVPNADRVTGPEFREALANALYIPPPVDAAQVQTLVQMREMYS